MPTFAAIDSNALTDLVDALGVAGYDSANDHSGLAHERVAMARLYFYGDCRFWVPPVARLETNAIRDVAMKDVHHRMTWYQLLDHDSDVDDALIERRTRSLMAFHRGDNDCRMVAESEAMETEFLVTRDKRLYERLQPHSTLTIVRPSELLDSLNVHCVSPHSLGPAPGNPLALVDWWRLAPCPDDSIAPSV